MSKFTRTRLARGVRLAVNHAFGALATIASRLSSKGITTENIESPRGPFRVNLWLPAMSFRYLWQGAAAVPEGTRHFSFPVPLIPTQDLVNTTGSMADGQAVPVLEEVCFSFDQGGEPGVYRDTGAVLLNDPFDFPADAEIKLSVLAKTPLWLSSEAGLDPDEELFSATMKPEAFVGRVRLNPQVWTNLGKTVNPYKTLLVVVSADKLGEAHSSDGNSYVLPSSLVSLRFSHRLVNHGGSLQNQPSHVGGMVADTVTVTQPPIGSVIGATGGTGLQSNLDILDRALGGRMKGGYQEDGWRPRVTHIQPDSVYDVIAVPMFANAGPNGSLNANNVNNHPLNLRGVPFKNVWDERLIPVTWPFEIHHVFAVLNYGGPGGATKGVIPTSPTLEHKVEVGLVSMVRSEQFALSRVAFLGGTLAGNIAANTVDKIRVVETQTMTTATRQHDLVMVPLVGAGGASIKSEAGAVLAQGTPVAVARGTTRSSTRSSLAGATPPTRGVEQFIRVAWKIEETGVPTLLTPAPAQHVYAGVGGNWVFILGRKTAVGDDFVMRM